MNDALISNLQSLRALVGAEAFAAAAKEVLESPPPTGKRGRVKKEKKTREPTEWNKFVRTVWEELKQSTEKVKYCDAMLEATRRRASGAVGGAAAAAGGAPAEDADNEEERRRVFQYLFQLQDSGRTNMLGCVPYLVRECGLDESTAMDYREEYVRNYDALYAKYGPAQAPSAGEGRSGRRGRKSAAADDK